MILKFKYRNHREEIADRVIIPDSLHFDPQYHEDYNHHPGWFISGMDMNKHARRSFAMTNIIVPEGQKEVLIDFRTTVDQGSVKSLLDAAKELVLSIENDNQQHGDILSQETLLKVAKLRQILEFYSR